MTNVILNWSSVACRTFINRTSTTCLNSKCGVRFTKELSLSRVTKQALRFQTNGASSPPRIVQVVASDPHGVRVGYCDGTTQVFRYIWLRDNCQCPNCYDTQYNFRRLNTWSLDENIKPAALWVTDEGHLGVKWPSSHGDEKHHKSIYNPIWLSRLGKAMGEKHLSLSSSIHGLPYTLWDREALTSRGIPQLPYVVFMDSENGLKLWLELFRNYGFVVLRDVPLSRESFIDVANRLAYIRETSFGYVFDIHHELRANIHPEHSAAEILLHTDLPFRERSPGIILLHCIDAGLSDDGSGDTSTRETVVVDGLYVSQWIREHHHEEFDLLSSVPVPYGYRDPNTGMNYSSYWPVIGLDEMGRIKEVHYSNYSRQPLQMPGDQIIPFYRALRLFSDTINEEKYQLRFSLRRGDLLAIHNRRILHGHTPQDHPDFSKCFRTCYLDLDEAMCKYEAIVKNEYKKKIGT